MLVFFPVGVCMGMGMGMGVGVTVRARGRANRDRHDGLVGHTAAVPLSEYSQALQNTRKQGIDNRASDRRRGPRVMM